MIDVKKFRDKILSIAFQGKLCSSIRDKEADYTLDQFHRTLKSFEPVDDSEKLITVPTHWNWSRLAYVTMNHGQIVPKETFSYIDVGTLDNINHCLATKENIIEADKAPSRARKVVEYGDVLYSTVRPYLHNICIVDKKLSYKPIASTAFCVMNADPSLLINKYLYYWLLTSEFDKYTNGDFAKGMLYPAISEKNLLQGPIPIPPINEQIRIVERIESIFNLLNTIETLQVQYFTNLTILKSKMIDAAIQGKLTEHLPEDGTGEELYQLVQEERRKQESLGLIKHEDLCQAITSKEEPFGIPKTWKWVRLGDVSYIIRGGSPRPIKQYITQEVNGINWIKIGDVEKGGKYIYKAQEKIKPEGEKKSRRVYPGDFLLTNSMSFGRPYISKIEGCIHDGWLLIRNLNGFDTDYLYYLLSSSFLYNQFVQKASGSTVDNLNIEKVKSAIIPLPPIAEQKRIVIELNTLLSLFE